MVGFFFLAFAIGSMSLQKHAFEFEHEFLFLCFSSRFAQDLVVQLHGRDKYLSQGTGDLF